MRTSDAVTESMSMLRVTLGSVSWTLRTIRTKKTIPYIALFVLSMGTGIILATVGGYITGAAVGKAAAGDRTSAHILVFWFVVCVLFLRLVEYVRATMWERVYASCIPLLYDAVYALFFEKPLGQIKAHASRLNHASIERGHHRSIMMVETIAYQVLPISIEVTVGLVGLFVVAPHIGMIVLTAAIAHVLSSVFLNRFILARMEPIERQHRAFNNRWIECIEKVVHVVTMGGAKRERTRLRKWHGAIMDADQRAWTQFAGLRLVRDLLTVGTVPIWVLWTLVDQIASGLMTTAHAIPVMLWFGMVIHAVNRWGDAERVILESAVRVSLMTDTLTMPPWFSPDVGEPLVRNGPIAIAFERVRFSYAGSSAVVLEDVSFTVPAGKSLALLGPTGAGKSTALELLLGFMHPTDGMVRVGGRDLRTLSLEQYHDICSYVPQEPQVLDGTLRENILFGVPPVSRHLWSDDRLWELVRLLQVDFGEARLTHGLDTVIGRNGQQLSGGQRQRLAILCAMMRQPRILVIDEGTSSLDSHTERMVVDGIKRAAEGVTTIVIAHRLKSVEHCDYFVFLDRAAGTEGSQVIATATSLRELALLVPQFRYLAEMQGLTFA
jgi:ABC-type multidrug transport system fused ATPase/permease subunit